MAIEKEVQIKLKLVGDKANVSAANTATATAQKAAKGAADAHVKEQERAAAHKQRILDRTARNEAKAYADSQKREERQFKDRIKNEEKLVRETERSAAAQKRAQEQAARAAITASNQRYEAERKVLHGALLALDATLNMAEGLAKVGLLSEESLEKVARGFVLVNGGFQAMKGGVQLLASAVDIMHNLRRATLAAAAAQGALSIAQGAGGAAGGAVGRAAGGVVGGAAAGGATGLAVNGGASLAGAASVAGAIALIGSAGVGLGLVLSSAAKHLGITEESWADSLSGIGKAWDASAKLEQQRLRLLQQQVADEEDYRASESLISSVAQAQAETRGKIAGTDARIRAVGGGDERSMLQGDRLSARSELEQAEANAEAARMRNIERTSNVQRQSYQDQMSAVQRLEDAQEAVAAVEERNVDILKRQTEERQRSVQAAQDQLEKAKALVEQEKSRSDSGLAKFAKLDPVQQQRVKDIASQGGPKSREEADFLEKSGIGSGAAGKFFTEEGRKAGGEAAVNSLEGIDIAGAISARGKAEAELQQTLDARKKSEDELLAATQAVTKALQALRTTQDQSGKLKLSELGVDTDALKSALDDWNKEVLGAIRAQADKAKIARERAAANQV